MTIIIIGAAILAIIPSWLPYITESTEPQPELIPQLMPQILQSIGIIIIAIMAMFLYILIISIIFALPRYAVVIDDLGAISGIKTGFKMFIIWWSRLYLSMTEPAEPTEEL